MYNCHSTQRIQESVGIARILDTGFLDTRYSLLSRTNLPALGAIPREHHASIDEDSSRSLGLTTRGKRAPQAHTKFVGFWEAY